ncbi:hypothetical protein HYY73_01240 [Candidatus Woesearchaeota archaeon]|nr:hypothetical protein [Candidatus Woesearchaeota archaeon]
MSSRHQFKHANYYEAIIQLRNPVGNVDDIMHFVLEAVKSKGQEGVFISKKKKVANGFDLYLSSNSFAVETGRQLFREFGGELKISRKLFSQHRMTSRVLYRMTVLFRMAPFSVGSFILLDGKAFKVAEIAKKIVVAENIETGKPFEFKYKDVARNFESLDVIKAIVSKVKPQLEIIHPKTFQSVPVLPLSKNSGLVPGEKVKILTAEGKVWLAT